MEKTPDADSQVKKIVAGRGLSPLNQKRLWARTTVIKRLLIKAGLTTPEEFEAEVLGMVRDIETKMETNIKQELGLE